MYKKVEYNKVCAYCGISFVAHNNRRIFCSKRCKNISSKVKRGISGNRSTEPYHKQCVVCGSKFDTFRDKQNTCCHECAELYHNEIRRKSAGEKLTKNCEICGKTFITSLSYQILCGSEDCKKAHNLITHRERNARHRDRKPKRKIVYDLRECAECGEYFLVDRVMNDKYCSDECRKTANNRRADKRIPKAQRIDRISLKRLYKRDSGICYLCGGLCDWNSKNVSKKGNEYPGDLYPTIEHVVPICDGGLDSWDNVRLAHWKCNLDKSIGRVEVDPMTHEFAISEKPKPTQAKKTAQYTLDGKLIKIWESTAAIERELGLRSKHIQDVCRGYNSNTGNAYGYHWEYLDDQHRKLAI